MTLPFCTGAQAVGEGGWPEGAYGAHEANGAYGANKANKPNSYDLTLPAPKLDLKFWKNRTNPEVKRYRFWDDMNFAGLPLFVAGLAIKGEKDAYRQNYEDPLHTNTRLVPHFETSIDNYLQYFGPALTVAL